MCSTTWSTRLECGDNAGFSGCDCRYGAARACGGHRVPLHGAGAGCGGHGPHDSHGVRRACERQGKALAQLCAALEEARGLRAGGFRCLACGLDIGLYKEALSRGIDELRDDAKATE